MSFFYNFARCVRRIFAAKPTIMKNIVLSFAIVCTALLSCKNNSEENSAAKTSTPKTYANLEKAGWLIGNWGNASAEGELTEFWKKTNDSVYHGESYFVVKNDTVFSESIELEDAKGKLTYIVTTPEENDAKPVRFEMTTITNDSIVFENPQHDFPNKITYTKITNGSLVARIYGTQNGKPATRIFTMARQK